MIQNTTVVVFKWETKIVLYLKFTNGVVDTYVSI